MRRLLLAGALVALALPATASAAPVPLTVQTQNLYLGADLTPALQATTAPQFFAAANAIWASVKAADFPSRAQMIADEIAKEDPDVVSLQEVARWTAVGGGEPSVDFLAEILGALGRRGLGYFVGAVSNNADIGPIPLPSPSAPSFTLRFQDRDVILVRDRAGLAFSDPDHGNFVAQAIAGTPVGPLSLNRGWASVALTVGGRSVRFVDTHLETEAAPAIQVAQAQELLAGPLAGAGTVVTAGDFSSAADGSTTATYGRLTATFADAWGNRQADGWTCCQAADLLNGKPLLHERSDLVLTRGAQSSPNAKAKVVGDRQADRTAAGLWPSEHAGLAATVYP